jgi:hypothetical protein
MAGAETAGVDVLFDVLEGTSEEVQRQVLDALALYAIPSKGQQDDNTKVVKLRGAFTSMMDYILGRMVPNLNDAQWIFVSTGSLGSRVSMNHGGKQVEMELVPPEVYSLLLAGRAAKVGRPAWAAPILDVEDRIQAIGRGELVGMDAASSRRRKPAKPLGSDQLKDKARERLQGLILSVKDSLSGVDSALNAFTPLRDENMFRGVKLNFEALKKYIAMAHIAPRNEAEAKFMSSVGDKLGAIALSVGGLGAQLESVGKELFARVQVLENRIGDLRNCQDDLAKLEAGKETSVAAFDVDVVASIRKDEDTLSMFTVKASETADNKVVYSGSRILVKEQWKDLGCTPAECIATVSGVVAAIEKISKFHINPFPRDVDGQFVLPPIIIEPIRNFVDYFDDRIVISLVCGDTPRRGPKVSLTPLEVEVMKACGQYLAKDSLYDYRGELNLGTFIGDYSGKVEQKTQVKWQGEDKKFSMAVTSQVVDAASRAEAVNDYVDCLFAFANSLQPPQKMSRRKVAVILRYCVVESIERTVALTLMHVAQAETAEAKKTILKYGKTDEGCRALMAKAFEDPQVAKVCGDRDFFITKLFGKQQ